MKLTFEQGSKKLGRRAIQSEEGSITHKTLKQKKSRPENDMLTDENVGKREIPYVVGRSINYFKHTRELFGKIN